MKQVLFSGKDTKAEEGDAAGYVSTVGSRAAETQEVSLQKMCYELRHGSHLPMSAVVSVK